MDVTAEREIFKRLVKNFTLPKTELAGWRLDQKINDRGIPVDMTFVTGATKIVAEEKANLIAEMRKLTRLENPNSTKQMLLWLKSEGYPFGSLGAKWVTAALQSGSGVSANGSRGLELRQQLSKSSTAKLEALANHVSPDGRLRRQYVFYGAARTGRWSGRAVQLQNLPRGNPAILKRFDEAVEAIRTGDITTVRQFGNPLDVVSSCLRGAFRA